jgi:uncharacterized coiled-coil DUF342 family protein
MTSSQRKLISSSRWPVAAIALTLALAAVAGCSSKRELTPEQQAQADVTAYEAQIHKIVPDPARADQLVALTNEFQQLATESIANVKSYRAKVAALNTDYDATRQDYEALFSQQDASREAFIKKAGALRERIAALTTDSEWEELKKARLRLLDADLEELLS